MSDPIDWLPDLILMADYQHDWQSFIDAVYAAFRRDFVDSRPFFRGKPVVVRRDPIYDGKEAGFWHCTSEGKTEDERIPDLRRCERIVWLRPIIEHCNDAAVNVWQLEKKGDRRCYLWCREEVLIVLADRQRYWQFITAFCSDREHTRKKLRAERDRPPKS